MPFYVSALHFSFVFLCAREATGFKPTTFHQDGLNLPVHVLTCFIIKENMHNWQFYSVLKCVVIYEICNQNLDFLWVFFAMSLSSKIMAKSSKFFFLGVLFFYSDSGVCELNQWLSNNTASDSIFDSVQFVYTAPICYKDHTRILYSRKNKSNS